MDSGNICLRLLFINTSVINTNLLIFCAIPSFRGMEADETDFVYIKSYPVGLKEREWANKTNYCHG